MSSLDKLEQQTVSDPDIDELTALTKWQLLSTFFSITCSTGFYAVVNGMFTVEIPTIARDVGLEESLLLWPLSIASLVTASTLLLGGSLVDVLGGKPIYIAGTFLQGAFTLGSGLARNSGETIAFRAMMGIAQSLCLPSSVRIITETFPAGRLRNMAFAAMGGGQPLGFSLGLVLGGVFTGTWGWRSGLYLVAGLTLGVVLLTAWGLQSSPRAQTSLTKWQRLQEEIDWVGILIASVCLALIGYVLASVSVQPDNIKQAYNIILLSISGILPFAFAGWMYYQDRQGKIALIPNSIWRGMIFTSICLSVLFTYGAFNSIEQILSLWMQIIEGTSPLMTGIQFIPQTVVGAIVNVVIGLFVHHWPSGNLIIGLGILELVPPILMALSDPKWIYWAAVFPALCINVIGADCLYTISNVLISREFPKSKQGLAGGVFNTMAQLGKSFGLALSAVVSSVVAQNSTAATPLMAQTDGYRASFWFCLGLNIIALGVGIFGLRKLGRVGTKQD